MIVASIDAIDLAVLPACFREIKSAFGIDQSALGILLFSRGISQALSAGIGGALGQRFARPLVLCCGCWTWGVGTLCVGLSPSYGAMLAAVALNGVGLGVIKPVIVSLIADLAPPGRVGRTFSVYDCVASVSTILGATVATVVAPLRIPFAPQLGECWRLIFAVLALIAALLGALIACCAREPRLDLRVRSAAVAAVELAPMDTVDSPRVRKNSGDARRASSGRCAVLCHEARAIACTTASAFRSVGRIPSFWVIIAQGGFGSMPWQSIGFLTLYFELGCYRCERASLSSLSAKYLPFLVSLPPDSHDNAATRTRRG
jgi:MFS family permease